MTNHPQLKQLIDTINSRDIKEVSFQYSDGHSAVLSKKGGQVIITSSNPQVTEVFYKVLYQMLQGKFKPTP